MLMLAKVVQCLKTTGNLRVLGGVRMNLPQQRACGERRFAALFARHHSLFPCLPPSSQVFHAKKFMFHTHKLQAGNILRAEFSNIGDVFSLNGISAGVGKPLRCDFELCKSALDYKLLGVVADNINFAGDAPGQRD